MTSRRLKSYANSRIVINVSESDVPIELVLLSLQKFFDHLRNRQCFFFTESLP